MPVNQKTVVLICTGGKYLVLLSTMGAFTIWKPGTQIIGNDQFRDNTKQETQEEWTVGSGKMGQVDTFRSMKPKARGLTPIRRLAWLAGGE